jgi:hypothetical protein
MKRTRTGRGAPPWAWQQTGPLTVDVEACMSNRDRERLAADAAARIPASIHNEAAFPERVAQSPKSFAAANTKETTLASEAAPHTPMERFATVKLVYTPAAEAAGPGSSHDRERTPAKAPEVESSTEKTGSLIDELPAFKAAMESLEKRGIPVFTTPAAKSTSNRPRSKPKPAKRKRNLLGARKSRRPSVPRKQSQPKTQAQIDVLRHRRVCTICHHPEREAIEENFLQWRNVRLIAAEFNATGGQTSIYRHARALGLFKKRNLTLRSSLEFVIEQSERIMPTAEGLVKAIRAYTRINDAGEWIDTPTTHIVKVVAMAHDGRSLQNPTAGLTLDVRKDRSNILYPTSGQIESASCPDEGRVQQALLPGSAQKVESDVTR